MDEGTGEAPGQLYDHVAREDVSNSPLAVTA